VVKDHPRLIAQSKFEFSLYRVLTFACVVLVVAGACTIDRTRRGYLRAAAAEWTAPPSNPVIVIPGFGVTRLLDPKIDRYVWGTPRATLRTVWPDDLDLPFDARTLTIGRDRLLPSGYVGSRGPINTGWQLMTALEKYGGYREGEHVYPFHYDWRLSALENAGQLDTFVKRVREEHEGAKVDVVTHSAGAIVALTWLKLGGGGAAVRNLVTIAPPGRGSIEAFRVMVRRERFIRRTFSPDVVATWPSIPELLPEEGTIFVDETGNALGLDLWSPATWLRFGLYDAALHPVFTASLARARTFRDRLRDTPLPPGVTLHVIAGDCVPTARRVIARSDGTFAFYPDELRPAEQTLRAIAFEPGDGTIPLSSASALARPAIFCDGHQGIATDPSVHRALVRILRNGS
jgi:pimeloyl-ACP methyl ester carboxylesterase